jgi:hypothetical protein
MKYTVLCYEAGPSTAGFFGNAIHDFRQRNNAASAFSMADKEEVDYRNYLCRDLQVV